MKNLMELLENNNKVVMNVSVYFKDDLFVMSGIKFNILDYSLGEDYIKLVRSDGAEIILSINDINYIEEDDVWYVEENGLEVYLIIEEKN